MKKINYFKEGIRVTSLLIDDIMFLFEFRMKDTYFTRTGRSKMSFKNIILFMINFVKKSLQRKRKRIYAYKIDKASC